MKLAAFLILICAACAPGLATANEQEDLAKLRERIRTLQEQLERSSESKSEASEALRDSERAISASNRRLGELGTQQRRASSEMAELHAQQAKVRAGMKDSEAKLSALLFHQYTAGQQDYLPLLLGNSDPNQAMRDLQYYGYMARAQAAWLASLRENLTRLDALSRQVRSKGDELAALQKDAAQSRKALEQDRRARLQVLARIQSQIRLQNREIGRLQHNEARLAQLVSKLGQMLTQNRDSPFLSLRGKLALPVKGRIMNRFGERRADTRTPWKGWYVRSRQGEEVRAIASGQVVFADWMRGFGNLLVIDHGKGYMSLYGHNETLHKQVGDTLHGGEVIAAAGNSGGIEEYGLYFELRHAGEPLDPAKWMVRR